MAMRIVCGDLERSMRILEQATCYRVVSASDEFKSLPPASCLTYYPSHESSAMLPHQATQSEEVSKKCQQNHPISDSYILPMPPSDQERSISVSSISTSFVVSTHSKEFDNTDGVIIVLTPEQRDPSIVKTLSVIDQATLKLRKLSRQGGISVLRSVQVTHYPQPLSYGVLSPKFWRPFSKL
ncbi:hypothetical protein BDQ17DRAFT_1411101 [Cyathus striatus]|nr:hypothetical protein BDQ17DRAFT_1411101 [Cyathus striatus]